MKENSFSNVMQENVSMYKQAFSHMNASSHNEFASTKILYDDDQVSKNINSQINFVRNNSNFLVEE
jgi:hypothetical protein